MRTMTLLAVAATVSATWLANLSHGAPQRPLGTNAIPLAGADGANSITSGLILRCSFDRADAKGPEESATKAYYDISKATWTSNGIIGGGFEFKGNGMLKVQGFNQPTETGEISLSVWVKPSIDLKEGVERNQFTTECWGPHQLEYARGGLLLAVYDKGHRCHHYHYPVTLKTGEWHNLAFTVRAGQQVRMFVNGDRVPAKLLEIIGGPKPGDPEIGGDRAPAVLDKQVDPSKQRLHVGAEGYNRWYFNGVLDELCIWSREIPPGQMKQIYRDVAGRGKK